MNRSDQIDRINKLVIRYEGNQVALKKEKSNKKQLKSQLKAQYEVLDLFQKVAQEVQNKAHCSLSSVVTKCLSIVFDEPYIFNIVFERKRNKTEARLVFMRGENEVDPLTSSGGGVIDVAAFALRMACMMLNTPAVRKTIVLDEPFRFVSESYQENIKEMVLYLADKLNIQFIYVTHNERLVTGNVIEV